MRTAAGGFLIAAALAGLVSPGRARACKMIGPIPHVIDSAMVGVDHTPPNLPKPTVAQISRHDGTGCMSGDSCGDFTAARITNLATDDSTSIERIGYRFALVAGALPGGLTLPHGAVDWAASDGSLWFSWPGNSDDVDFTLQLVAVDAAGNESAPQTVRIHDDLGACSIGGPQPSWLLTLFVAALALAAARRRSLLLALLVTAAVATPGRANACSPINQRFHEIDPALVGVDQMPPALSTPRVAEIHHYDGTGCDGSSNCGDHVSARITNLATDDMTSTGEIGYRLTVVSGTGFTPHTNAILGSQDGSLWIFVDHENDVDVTVQIVAIDAAGNESAPQMLRIQDDKGLCSIGSGRPIGIPALAIVAIALAAAARRRRSRTGLRSAAG